MSVINAKKLEYNRRHETWEITFSKDIASYAKSELLDLCAAISFLWDTNIKPINDNTVIYTGYID